MNLIQFLEWELGESVVQELVEVIGRSHNG